MSLTEYFDLVARQDTRWLREVLAGRPASMRGIQLAVVALVLRRRGELTPNPQEPK